MARLCIMHFAEAMEAKLAKHDKDRGEQGWEDDRPFLLFDRMDQEASELHDAISFNDEAHDQIMEEAADVANFAMMIFDNARRAKLREEQKGK